MNEAHIYRALGDPVRLAIVRRLALQSTCTVGELCKDFDMTRQGARKQIQVLVDTDLVLLKKRGREIDAELNIDTIQRARVFMAQLESQWDSRLNALKSFVEKTI